MKTIIFLIFLFFGKESFSQRKNIQNVWIGKSSYYLSIDSQYVILEERKNLANIQNPYKAAYYLYEIVKDTLVLFREVSKNSEHDKIILLKFIIEKYNFDQLILRKIFVKSDNSEFSHFHNIFWNDSIKIFKFFPQTKLFKNSLKFEKIKFSSSKCYGICPEMKLEIDKDKNIKFYGGSLCNKKGYFKGKLSDSLFNELIFIIKISDVEGVLNANNFNIDAPFYAIEVHFNKIYSFTHTSFLPLVYIKLNKFLLELYTKVDFKDTEKFEIEFCQPLKSNGF